jgi:hypothetical protein
LLLSAVVLAFSACSTRDNRATDVYNIPWPAADSSYHFQDVSIPELSSPETLSGPDVSIIVTPGENAQGLTGATPVGRYLVTKRGTRVPTDPITTQAVAVHGHIQRLRELTRAVGAEDLLSWPLTIAVEAHSSSKGGAFENNAYFDSGLNALVMTNYSDRDLPLSMNGGVIGHEFFHMLFNAIVMSRLQNQLSPQVGLKNGVRTDDGSQLPFAPESPFLLLTSPQQNSYLLRAINEGLADFWGWVYTGDTNFVGRSLTAAGHDRLLNARFVPLQSTGEIRARISGLDPVNQLGEAYVLGTSYARFFRQLTLELAGEKSGESSPEKRQVVARALIQALKSFSPIVASTFSVSDLSPNEILLAVYAQLPTVDARACTLFDEFASSTAARLGDRPSACASFPKAQP